MTREELREAVLAIAREKRDTKIRPVPTPEWPDLDGNVHVRSFSVSGREQYLDTIRTITPVQGEMPTVKVTLVGAGAKLAAYTMCNEVGELLFVEEDIPLLNDLSALAMERVIDISSELNEMDDKSALEKLRLAKNVSAPVVAAVG